MKAYRLHRSRFAAADPAGARRSGGRWNSPGTAIVYASSSLALCCLEVIVHFRDPELVPTDYVYTEIEVPDDLCDAFPYERGTEGYRMLMESEELALAWGDRFVRLHQDRIALKEFVRQRQLHARWRPNDVFARIAERLGLAAGVTRPPRQRREQLTPVQAVPSLVIPQEMNFLIDTYHPWANELKWSKPEHFEFDPRTISSSFR